MFVTSFQMIQLREDYKKEMAEKSVNRKVEECFERKIIERFTIKKEIKKDIVNFVTNFEPVKDENTIENKIEEVNERVTELREKDDDDLKRKIDLILNMAVDKFSGAHK